MSHRQVGLGRIFGFKGKKNKLKYSQYPFYFFVLNTAVFRNTGHIMDYICNTHFYKTGEIIEQLIYRKLEY